MPGLYLKDFPVSSLRFGQATGPMAPQRQREGFLDIQRHGSSGRSGRRVAMARIIAGFKPGMIFEWTHSW